MLTLTALNSVPDLRHGFFTRHGGVSRGDFASLNCSYGGGDDPHSVNTNRQIALQQLGTQNLVILRQIHSAQVVIIEQPRHFDFQGDALVTKQRGLTLGILTADCAPVLLVDPQQKVIGAAHAGWRGAKAGIIEACVHGMISLGANAKRILAAIGPCIGVASYPVSDEFPSYFPDAPDCLQIIQGHWSFDLRRYVHNRLKACCVSVVEWDAPDTAVATKDFFSHRYAQGRPHGNCLSAIGCL